MLLRRDMCSPRRAGGSQAVVREKGAGERRKVFAKGAGIGSKQTRTRGWGLLGLGLNRKQAGPGIRRPMRRRRPGPGAKSRAAVARRLAAASGRVLPLG